MFAVCVWCRIDVDRCKYVLKSSRERVCVHCAHSSVDLNSLIKLLSIYFPYFSLSICLSFLFTILYHMPSYMFALFIGVHLKRQWIPIVDWIPIVELSILFYSCHTYLAFFFFFLVLLILFYFILVSLFCSLFDFYFNPFDWYRNNELGCGWNILGILKNFVLDFIGKKKDVFFFK